MLKKAVGDGRSERNQLEYDKYEKEGDQKIISPAIVAQYISCTFLFHGALPPFFAGVSVP